MSRAIVKSGTVILAREVQVGDRIVLQHRGSRVVLDVQEYDEDTGPDPGPRIKIIYGLGASIAFENSASKGKHPSAITQPEAGYKPLKRDDEVRIEPDERVAIERRSVA
jgi:hypothetical protein